jgi:hypothetical protein
MDDQREGMKKNVSGEWASVSVTGGEVTDSIAVEDVGVTLVFPLSDTPIDEGKFSNQQPFEQINEEVKSLIELLERHKSRRSIQEQGARGWRSVDFRKNVMRGSVFGGAVVAWLFAITDFLRGGVSGREFAYGFVLGGIVGGIMGGTAYSVRYGVKALIDWSGLSKKHHDESSKAMDEQQVFDESLRRLLQAVMLQSSEKPEKDNILASTAFLCCLPMLKYFANEMRSFDAGHSEVLQGVIEANQALQSQDNTAGSKGGLVQALGEVCKNLESWQKVVVSQRGGAVAIVV